MADTKEPVQSVQTFGRKKTATAVAYCKRGKGVIRVNGCPLEQVEPKPLQFKLQEPILLLGKDRFSEVDIRIRVKGGGRVSQIYAIRQALSKALVAYYQKCKSSLLSFPIASKLRPICIHFQTLTNKARKPSRIYLCNTTEPCLWLTLDDASRRSSVDPAPGQDTKSLTVKAVLEFMCLFLPL